MKLGMEVGLGPDHMMLDGHPTPPKGAQPPIFGPCLFWPNGWMGKDATALGTEVGFRSGDIVLDVDPAPPPKSDTAAPIFGPCLLWPNG